MSNIGALRDKLTKYNKIIFHAGAFHADEIFATAYLMIIYDWIWIPFPKFERKNILSPYMAEENGYLVYDIGGGRFDHHFPEDQKQRREDGTPYAAFGLIVKEFHDGFLSNEEYQMLDQDLIKGLDKHDNTGCENPLADIISCINPTWDNPNPNVDMLVWNAISLARDILENKIAHIRSTCKAKKIADTSTDIADGCVYLDVFAPIGRYVADNPNISFMGFPSNRELGKYSISAIKCKGDNDKLVNRMLFPERFRGFGLRSPNYFEVNYKTGLSFMHPSGFMATFDNKELAKKFMHDYYDEFENNINK